MRNIFVNHLALSGYVRSDYWNTSVQNIVRYLQNLCPVVVFIQVRLNRPVLIDKARLLPQLY